MEGQSDIIKANLRYYGKNDEILILVPNEKQGFGF